jgi:transcriptional regulator with XRE-family HTH domain
MATNDNSSPTVRRRRLADILTQLRKDAGMTATAVAAALDTTQSRISRIETGKSAAPRGAELRQMLKLYGVTDDEADKLVVVARESRIRGWWHSYRDVLSEEYATLVGLEDGAEEIRQYEPSMIPGLLQTEDYARAVVVAGSSAPGKDRAERLVRVRMERQAVLRRIPAVRLRVVLDEAVLYRKVGGPGVMAGQYARLAEYASDPSLDIRVIPFSAGAHPGVDGAFELIRFPGSDPDVVYAETSVGGLYAEKHEDTDRIRQAFDRLAIASLSSHATLEMVARFAARS